MTLTGPDGVYFAVGFGQSAMKNTYVIIVDGDGNVNEQKLGDHDPGNALSGMVSVKSNSVSNGIRTVVLTRDL